MRPRDLTGIRVFTTEFATASKWSPHNEEVIMKFSKRVGIVTAKGLASHLMFKESTS